MRKEAPALGWGTMQGSLEEAMLEALESRDRGERLQAISDAAHFVDPEKLVEMVGDHGNADRRNAAMDALVRAGARGVPTVIRALQNEDPELATFAASILGKSGDAGAIPHLVRLLDHDDLNVVQQAIDSLAQLRAVVAVDSIVKLIDRDPWLKFAAVHALGEIGDSRAVDSLLALVGDDLVGEAAIEALGKIGAPEALGHLSRLLRECRDTRTFTACLRAIGQVLDQTTDEQHLLHIASFARLGLEGESGVSLRVREVLSEPETNARTDTELRGAAIEVIRALRIRPLYSALVMAGRDPELRELLQFCAVSIGKELTPALVAGLTNPNGHVRAMACDCLGLLQATDARRDIVKLLSDPNALVRASAAATIGRLDDERSIPALVPLLADLALEVRSACVGALKRMKSDAVTEALLEFVKPDTSRYSGSSPPPSHASKTMPPPVASPAAPPPPPGPLPTPSGAPPAAAASTSSPLACIGALEVMRANPNVRQRRFIAWCLANPEPSVRRAAVAATAAQPGQGAVPLLSPLLSDPDTSVRAEVVAALGTCGDRRARELLLEQIERDPGTLGPAVRSLGQLGDATVAPRLIELYGRTSTSVRLDIIEALAELKEVAAEPVLVRLMGDEEPTVRRAAVAALGSYATRTALRHVLGAARDPEWAVRAAAVEVLAKTDDAQARATIERLCLDANEDVAAAARRYRDERRRSAPPEATARGMGT
jgi:HEAT repeat protein